MQGYLWASNLGWLKQLKRNLDVLELTRYMFQKEKKCYNIMGSLQNVFRRDKNVMGEAHRANWIRCEHKI
jgi:hypothetical protein